jgi:hypothetical protein
MFIYNVTCNVSPEIHDEWLNWMKSEHIPNVMATNCFKEFRFCRILVNEEHGVSYSIQYMYQNEKDIELYAAKFAPSLQAETKNKYGDKVLAFRTLLEFVK